MWKFPVWAQREINVVIIKASVAAGVRGFCGCRDKSFLLSVKNKDGVVESFSTDMWAMTDYDKNNHSETKESCVDREQPLAL